MAKGEAAIWNRTDHTVRHTGECSAPTNIPPVAPQTPVTVAETPQPTTQPNGTQLDAARDLLALVQRLTAGQVDAAQVRSIVDAALTPALDALRAEMRGAIKPQTQTIVVNPQGEARTVKEHTHPLFAKVVKLVSAGVPVLLKGPAGCGKTHLGEQVARALGLDYGTLHCTAGVTESQLLGWLLPTGEGGRFEYKAAPYARLYKQGKALFCLDEIDAADPNLLMVLNGSIANGHLAVPQNHDEPLIPRGEGFALIACANTWGHGADAQYVGRNQLDAATISRFYALEMDYDETYEAKIAPQEICRWVWDLRRKAKEAKLRRVVCTRTLQRIVAAVSVGIPLEEAQADVLASWTADERAKVGV